MTDATNSLPQTENEAWGFYGSMTDHGPREAWKLAMTAVSTATGAALDETRAFLDSRYGRHFGSDVSALITQGASMQDAIEATAKTWMAWTISKGTAKHTGIPAGLPYLTGFVTHATIESE